MQEKLAGELALVHKATLLVQMDGRQIIHAHMQVDLANRPALSGPLDQAGKHLTLDAQILATAQDSHHKLTHMLQTRTRAHTEGQRSRQFPRDPSNEIEAG
jgi:hypothetical protein